MPPRPSKTARSPWTLKSNFPKPFQWDEVHRQVGVDSRDVHRAVEVHLTDGEQFWLWVAAGNFEEVADRLSGSVILSVASWDAPATSTARAA